MRPLEITTVLDLAERYVDLNRRTVKQSDVLAGMTQINLFFENSTRTQSSFELAGKRLGADVMNMSVAQFVGEEGRDPDRHRDDAERDAPRPAGGAARRPRAR